MTAPRRKSLPPRLAVFHALCALSEDGYRTLGRMILSTARAERDARQARERRRRLGRRLREIGP